MKRTVILFALAIIFFTVGCSSRATTESNDATMINHSLSVSGTSVIENKIYSESIQKESSISNKSAENSSSVIIVPKARTNNADMDSIELKPAKEQRKYIRKNFDIKSKEEITQLVIGLFRTQLEECEELNDEMEGDLLDRLAGKDYSFLEEIKKSNKLSDKALNEFVIKVESDGYEINFYEGYYAVVEFSFSDFYEEFQKYVTAEYRDYFRIKFAETPYGAEGNIVASLDELIKMIEDAFKFINDYPYSADKDEILGIYSTYLSYYFDPEIGHGRYIMDKDIFLFSQEHINSLKSISKSYSGTALGDIVSRYLVLLEENNFEYSKPAKDFVVSNCR